MTTTLPELPAIDSPRSCQPGKTSSNRALLRSAAVTVPAGAALIVLGYHHAAGLSEPDGLQFALYWAGFLMGMLSLAAIACSRETGGVARTCALIGIGLFGMIPRLQRFGPAGSDEFIHLRQAMEAYLNGEVGHTLYLLPISKEFFGLHQLTSAFAQMTQFPLWYAAMAVITLAHILSVLAVYQLIRAVGVPAPGAAVGAVVYTLNPSWLFFNAAFSYESVALPLVLWCLAATVSAGRATRKPALRSISVALFCVFALPMIHHLSTIMLCVILLLLMSARLAYWFPRTLAGGVGAAGERLWPLALIWFSLLASIHLWWSEKYDWLLSYLSPAWTEGLSQLGKILDGVGKSSGQRSLFGNSANPVYEVISGYLYPFIVLALFLWSCVVLWRNRTRVATALWAFAILGTMFFASMPMVLTHGGAEGAHRSWGYSFIGIAVLCGMGWSCGPRSRRVAAGNGPPMSRALRDPRARAGIACVVFTVLAFGSATLGVNLSTRFPGTANVGDDARSMSKEGMAVAAWMNVRAPVDTPVLADRYVSLQIGSLGRMSALRPSANFPIWDLYMSAEPVRPEVLKQIWDSRIRYFVVDSRMGTVRPRLGYWFTRNEPGVRTDRLFPEVALDRFDCLPWLRGVFAAGPLTVYEVDRDALRKTPTGACEEPTA
ncbi:hypothetical protein [Mycolicibacterium sp. S3B2]|uniref:hypothetical protein n=1 Tax=Mycolicibacterium sp. S3B2 TaxID=3415120 RepID=UPI003C7EB2F5